MGIRSDRGLRRVLRSTSVHAGAAAMLCGNIAVAQSPPPSYVLHELTVDFGLAPIAYAINDDGLIVGESIGGCFALWTPLGGTWVAGDPVIDCACPCSVIKPNAIGNDGTVVGEAYPNVSSSNAWVSTDGSFEVLNAGNFARALDVNALGQVVGNNGFPVPPSQQQGFIVEGGKLSLLPAGYAASSITDDSTIVGAVDGVAALIHRVGDRWIPSKLGTIAGESFAVATNGSGQVAGMAYSGSGNSVGFLWEDSAFTALGTLGGTYAHVSGLTESGRVFGWSNRVEFGDAVAFLWQDGTMHEFNDLVIDPWLSVRYLFGTNAHGHIVGYGQNPEGDFVPFVAIPVVPGDLNFDGTVDGADLGILLNAWGQDGLADLNGDGTVDGADLGILLNAWSR